MKIKFVDALGTRVKAGYGPGWSRVGDWPCLYTDIRCSDCRRDFNCGELAFEVDE